VHAYGELATDGWSFRTVRLPVDGPQARIACPSLADRDFGDWAKRAWPWLSDEMLASYPGLI
jgi:hypothetical protein